jgi:hypothetical protein
MSWPVAESQRRHASVPHRRTPRSTWVLVALAFLCGGLLSAAGFSVGWKHEAQRGSSAQSALLAANANAHVLSGRLASVRTALVTARKQSSSLAASERAISHTEAQLRNALAEARKAQAGVATAAAPVSADLDRMTSELHALTGYLSSTPAAQLDAGYVAAQVAYLTKTVDGFRSDVGALAARAAPAGR